MKLKHRRSLLTFGILFGFVALSIPDSASADFHKGGRKKDWGRSCETSFNKHGAYHQGRWGNGFNSAIHQGIRSGELSHREAAELRAGQRELREKAIAYRSDGYLSNWERRDLRDDFKDLRGDLRHELSDGEHRREYWRRNY